MNNSPLHLYILIDKKPVRTKDYDLWSEFLLSSGRRVANTQIKEVNVSTVFVGIAHPASYACKPLLFETMIFGGEFDGMKHVCATWESAEANHRIAVDLVEKSLGVSCISLNGSEERPLRKLDRTK